MATGDITKAVPHAPADLVLACHVLYFWADPARDLRRVREILAPDGHIALGYQLRQHMPPISQRTFPREGFTLYDSDDPARWAGSSRSRLPPPTPTGSAG